ncbi:uncharacterized protein HKW66_Vig0189210 [Vigna angularis]|uniref:Uncharacterized protein n=1 Tax=Phaseolus angularis TaxID=3914 RepID=A0A8T0KV92_PHAAN|nr:uncharacterized protein HKW66_Vig0189210 [Vigna angularis]
MDGFINRGSHFLLRASTLLESQSTMDSFTNWGSSFLHSLQTMMDSVINWLVSLISCLGAKINPILEKFTGYTFNVKDNSCDEVGVDGEMWLRVAGAVGVALLAIVVVWILWKMIMDRNEIVPTLNVANKIHKSDIRLGFFQTIESFLRSLQTMMDYVINWLVSLISCLGSKINPILEKITGYTFNVKDNSCDETGIDGEMWLLVAGAVVVALMVIVVVWFLWEMIVKWEDNEGSRERLLHFKGRL